MDADQQRLSAEGKADVQWPNARKARRPFGDRFRVPVPVPSPSRKYKVARRWTVIASGLLLLALALVVIYTAPNAFLSPIALVAVAAIGLAALLLQVRFRRDLPNIHSPLWLNVLGILCAMVSLFADYLRTDAPNAGSGGLCRRGLLRHQRIAHPARTAAAVANAATDCERVGEKNAITQDMQTLKASPCAVTLCPQELPIYNAPMRVTLFGASGLLGHDLVPALRRRATHRAFRRRRRPARPRAHSQLGSRFPSRMDPPAGRLHRRGWLRVEPRIGFRRELRRRGQRGRGRPRSRIAIAVREHRLRF